MHFSVHFRESTEIWTNTEILWRVDTLPGRCGKPGRPGKPDRPGRLWRQNNLNLISIELLLAECPPCTEFLCLSRFLCFFKNAQKSAQKICAFLKTVTVPCKSICCHFYRGTSEIQIKNNCWQLTVHHINKYLVTGFVHTTILSVNLQWTCPQDNLNKLYIFESVNILFHGNMAI